MALTADLELSSTGDLLFNNDDLSLVFDDDLAVQLFKIILRSNYGDWPLFPLLGANIKDFTRRPNTEENANELQDRLYSITDNIEYLNDYHLVIDAYPTDVDDLRLDINLLNEDGEPIEMQFDFDLVRGSVFGIDEYTYEDHNIYTNQITTRIEKIYVKERTNIIRLNFIPVSIEGESEISIYKSDEFSYNEGSDEVYLTYNETVPLTDEIKVYKILDFKQTDAYTSIINNKTVMFIYINDFPIDMNAITDSWTYYIPVDIMNAIVNDGVINLTIMYNSAYTSGYLFEKKGKIVSDNAIAPELEDNNIYYIKTRKYLEPGAYFVRYNSYSIIE